ncbi:MAG: hypothetical protein P8178_09830 [Candidatus Thiodiazotropha sp.]
MATIQIKDLDDSREMDRKAMRAVAGGCAGTTYSGDLSPYRSTLTQPTLSDRMFGWASFAPDDRVS